MSPEQGWNAKASVGVHGVYAAWYKLAVYGYEGGSDTTSSCDDRSMQAKANFISDPRMAADITTTYLNG